MSRPVVLLGAVVVAVALYVAWVRWTTNWDEQEATQ